jgi:hypothetical protein
MEDMMDIKILEKEEVCRIIDMLTARLADGLKREYVLAVRIEGLEKAVTAAGKENRAERLSRLEASAWQERAQELSKELRNAKTQWEEYRESLQEILDQRDHAMGERDKARSELEEKRRASEKQAAGWVAAEAIFKANAKRLERELRECRATVMNEISAMIPKAVRSELLNCTDLARNIALEAGFIGDSDSSMRIVNMLKARAEAKDAR